MSTTTAASSVNGASGVTTPVSSTTSNASGSKAQLRMNTSGKALDGARKQAGSPIDGAQRKPTQKAWTQGTNPITQRPTNQGTPNGASTATKPAVAPKAGPASMKETNTPERHANDRLMFLLANFVGLMCNVTLKNGERYSGVFSGATLEPSESRYVLKMAKRLHRSKEQQVNGTSEAANDFVGVGEDHVMAFEVQDVVDLSVSDVTIDKAQVKPQNGVSSSFRTDSDIAGNLAQRERTLQRWEPAADGNTDMSLENSGKSDWDQFEVNERLYGVKSNYDENIYTTTINRSDPLYKQRAAEAEKVAREIEASGALNTHVAEERGLRSADDSGMDEEAKYSGVGRDFPALPSGQPNKYTPPARRPPTGQPTVAGAPVDPAIISASLARPESASTSAMRTPDPTTPSTQAGEPKQQIQNPSVNSAANAEKPVITTDDGMKPAPTGIPSEPEVKATTTDEQAATPAKPDPTDVTASSANRRMGRPENATATVEHDVLDSFKQFSAMEKMRVQERQRTIARQDKAVKLNDLKKFSQNFKLHTPVPRDLVPILAKDKEKQDEIIEKSLRQVEELKTTPTLPATATSSPTELRVQQPTLPHTGHNSPIASLDRQNMQRGRPSQGNFAQPARGDRTLQNQLTVPRSGPGMLSARLANTVQQHQRNTAQQSPMQLQELRIPPAGPSATMNGVQSPTSSASSRFNVRALEFRPNPAANTFTPGGSSSTGSTPGVESASRQDQRKPHSSFFGGKNPVPASERPSILDDFNPIKRMKAEVEKENKSKEFEVNRGIPQAYRTPPVWEVAPDNVDKTYMDMFQKTPAPVPSVSPAHTVLANGPIPHQHQLPLHLQQGAPVIPPTHTPHQTPRHIPVQPHHGPNGPHHFDEHRMQYHSAASSVHPSPRAMPPFVAYNAQGPQPIQAYAQGIPSYGMSPNGQPVPLRPYGGGAIQFVGQQPPAVGGHMMTNSPSAGPFMGVPVNMGPQVQMYSPIPGHVYPHHSGPMPPQPGPNGFPSPRPGAPMMSHQGSQQGHPQPVVFMHQGGHGPAMIQQHSSGPMTPMRGAYPQPHQPHYISNNHQHPHFTQQQHRGTPSGSYAQPMMPTHSMPLHGPPPTGPAQHMPDPGEEVK